MARYFLVLVLPNSCLISNTRLTSSVVTCSIRAGIVALLRLSISVSISFSKYSFNCATLLGLSTPVILVASVIKSSVTFSSMYRAPSTKAVSTSTP
ncbi:hypothetical protein D3C71_1577730 [compost metagenome]